MTSVRVGSLLERLNGKSQNNLRAQGACAGEAGNEEESGFWHLFIRMSGCG